MPFCWQPASLGVGLARPARQPPDRRFRKRHPATFVVVVPGSATVSARAHRRHSQLRAVDRHRAGNLKTMATADAISDSHLARGSPSPSARKRMATRLRRLASSHACKPSSRQTFTRYRRHDSAPSGTGNVSGAGADRQRLRQPAARRLRRQGLAHGNARAFGRLDRAAVSARRNGDVDRRYAKRARRRRKHHRRRLRGAHRDRR